MTRQGVLPGLRTLDLPCGLAAQIDVYIDPDHPSRNADGALLRRHDSALRADPDWAARITIRFLRIFISGNIIPNDSLHLDFSERIIVNRRGEARVCCPTFPLGPRLARSTDLHRDRKKDQFPPSHQNPSQKGRNAFPTKSSYISANFAASRASRQVRFAAFSPLNVLLCEKQNSQQNRLCGIFAEYLNNHLLMSFSSRQTDPSVGIKIPIRQLPSIRKYPLAKLGRDDKLNLMLLARPHQAEAIGFCLRNLRAGHSRCVVQMPTGSGKSFVIRRVAQAWIKKGGNAFILCPTEEVIEQQRLDSVREGMFPVIEQAERHASQFARYTIGSFNTMWRRCEKHRRSRSLLLVDECHHFNYDAPTNLKIGNIFERAIGFSATPWSIGCLDFFENRLHVYPLSEAVRVQVNCNYRIEDWIDPVPGRYQVVYCSNFDEIQQMCLRISPSDFAAYQAADARLTISRFRLGLLGTIVVNRMLTEGFDQPQIKRLWIARNTESEIAALQMAGRALRPYKGQSATLYIQSEQTQNTLLAALERAR